MLLTAPHAGDERGGADGVAVAAHHAAQLPLTGADTTPFYFLSDPKSHLLTWFWGTGPIARADTKPSEHRDDGLRVQREPGLRFRILLHLPVFRLLVGQRDAA